jgi:hypothetical protein
LVLAWYARPFVLLQSVGGTADSLGNAVEIIGVEHCCSGIGYCYSEITVVVQFLNCLDAISASTCLVDGLQSIGGFCVMERVS